MFTEQIIEKLDYNNTKALSVAELLILALDNGLDEDVDVVANLEVVRDYLKNNYMIFDKQTVGGSHE